MAREREDGEEMLMFEEVWDSWWCRNGRDYP